MTESEAHTEAQKRANRTGGTILVVYASEDMALDWRNRYRACWSLDRPPHSTIVEEVTPDAAHAEYWREFWEVK
jgi:hypothetical protein